MRRLPGFSGEFMPLNILRSPWNTFHISFSCPSPFITEQFESVLQYFLGKHLKAKGLANNSLTIGEDVLCSPWLQHLGTVSCKMQLKFSLVNREVMLRSQGEAFTLPQQDIHILWVLLCVEISPMTKPSLGCLTGFAQKDLIKIFADVRIHMRWPSQDFPS